MNLVDYDYYAISKVSGWGWSRCGDVDQSGTRRSDELCIGR